MQLVQLPELGGFSLTWADALRKAVAKKDPSSYKKMEEEFFRMTAEKKCGASLCRYTWLVLVSMSRGYSFNASHTLAYSMLALQEMNLAYKFPIIFWNCACLITDSGGDEEDSDEILEEVVDIYEPEDFEEFEYIDAPDKKTKVKKKRAKTTDYKKIATAIGEMQQAGVKIELPNINESKYTYTPSVEENKIYYGLSGIMGVGEEAIAEIIQKRPYASPKDFFLKVKPKRQVMISLIKGGAFDTMLERKTCLAWYIWEVCDKKQRLTLQNMPSLIQNSLLPTTGQYALPYSIYEFNRYLKSICKSDMPNKYILDDRGMNFLTTIQKDELVEDGGYLDTKKWDKVYQSSMDAFRDWINSDKDNILNKLNEAAFLEEWNKYVKKNNYSSWEMSSLSFYYHEHELCHVNKNKYGIVNYFDLPEEPEIAEWFTKGNRKKLYFICGTCIAKNKNKSTLTLLTPEGVVNVKFNKEHFSLYDRQISAKMPDGTKKILEKSWFSKGEMVLIQGFRSGDNFIPKKYSNSVLPHTLYKIIDITPEGELQLTTERYGEGEINV